MTNKNRRRFYWLGVIVICAAIFPPVIFGAAPEKSDRKGGDPWRNTIEDFQTLITGFFAIGAAFFTVRQMQESDRLSALRHIEALNAELLPNRIAAERVRDLYKAPLDRFAKNARAFFAEEPRIDGVVEWTPKYGLALLAIVQDLKLLTELGETEAVKSAALLFNLQVETMVTSMAKMKGQFDEMAAPEGSTGRNMEVLVRKPTWFDALFVATFRGFIIVAELMSPFLDDWCDSVGNLTIHNGRSGLLNDLAKLRDV